jgi:uncharacterized membrane protein
MKRNPQRTKTLKRKNKNKINKINQKKRLEKENGGNKQTNKIYIDMKDRKVFFFFGFVLFFVIVVVCLFVC